jgi:hypothetical protein
MFLWSNSTTQFLSYLPRPHDTWDQNQPSSRQTGPMSTHPLATAERAGAAYDTCLYRKPTAPPFLWYKYISTTQISPFLPYLKRLLARIKITIFINNHISSRMKEAHTCGWANYLWLVTCCYFQIWWKLVIWTKNLLDAKFISESRKPGQINT